MNRPRLRLDPGSLRPGLAAVALFVVMAAIFLTATLPTPAGFGENAAVMKSLGAAMFGLEASQIVGENATAVPSEGFLVAFEIIDVVLVAALVGAVMLARRETGDETVTVATAEEREAAEPATATAAADGGDPDAGGDD